MIAPPRPRWELVEYAAPTSLVSAIAEASGQTRPRVRELLNAAGDRVAAALRFSQNPLDITTELVRATDFAGLLRVGPGIELEIAPKFLGGDARHAGWREDFFFLALLSRHGHLLSVDRLRALAVHNVDLATLVGRAIAQLYWDNHRRPLRTYRRAVVRDFSIHGDVDPEALGAPDAEGYEQTLVQYDRRNPYNATIRLAILDLVPEVRDPELRATLDRIAQILAPQGRPRRAEDRRLPNRSRRWQTTYDLAVDVLRGFGLSYASGAALAPGYVLTTWRVWEDLLGLALRLSVGGSLVRTQHSFVLGHRHRNVQDGVVTRPVTVTPDVVIQGAATDAPRVLIDAKYKGHVDKGRQRIAEADVYEALAFCTASACPIAVLVYPHVPLAGSPPGLGQASVLEIIEIGSVRIVGLEIDVRGISSRGGLKVFADQLVKKIDALIAKLSDPQTCATGAR